MSNSRLTALTIATLLAFPAASFAQQQQPYPSTPIEAGALALKRSVELTVGSQRLTAPYGSAQEVDLRGIYELAGGHMLQGELSSQRRFGTSGVFAGVSDTYTINPDYFASIAVGAGDGAFYLPRIRLDAFLYRKWLAKKNLVGSIGLGYYNAPDVHHDRSLSLGAAYYFDQPWIFEGGIRFNVSDPGAVHTHQQFLALTWGREKQDLVTARYGWGGEGYSAIGPATTLVNFQSHETILTWRHWVNLQTGFLVGANSYDNPTYKRTGVSVGIFHQLQ